MKIKTALIVTALTLSSGLAFAQEESAGDDTYVPDDSGTEPTDEGSTTPDDGSSSADDEF